MVNRCMIFPKSDPKGRSCYMGEFAGGLMHGVGVLYFQQHETRYEGQFQNDVKEGEGTLTYVSGDVYQGSWKTDRASGYGVLKYRSGDTYTGNFVNGVKSGDGILSYKNQ